MRFHSICIDICVIALLQAAHLLCKHKGFHIPETIHNLPCYLNVFSDCAKINFGQVGHIMPNGSGQLHVYLHTPKQITDDTCPACDYRDPSHENLQVLDFFRSRESKLERLNSALKSLFRRLSETDNEFWYHHS